MVWRADPAVTHPRLLSRLRAGSRRRGRVRSSSSTTGAPPPPRRPTCSSRSTPRATSRRCGRCARSSRARRSIATALASCCDALGELAERLRGAGHVAFLHGALDELGALALLSLVRDLSHDRHAVTLALRGDGNARGAEDVLAWQTGFPAAVSFAARPPAREPGRAQRRRAARARRGRRRARGRLRRARAAAGPARAADRGRRRARHRDGEGGARGLRHRGRRHRGRGHRAPAWTACPLPLRAPLDGDAPERPRTCWPRSRGGCDAAHRRRPRLRPRQRHRRRGARRLRAGRQDRRRRRRARPHASTRAGWS